MKRMLMGVIALMFFSGCTGFGSFHNRASYPTETVESDSHIGWFGGSSNFAVKHKASTYQVCMDEYAGDPTANQLCQCRDWSGGTFPGAYYSGVWYPAGQYGYQAYCGPVLNTASN